MSRLKFRIETRKIKQPRIVVLRLIQEKDKIIEKSLGSFSSKRGYENILQQLTPEELYEFENFVKTISFSKTNFDCNADKLDRFIIKSAPEFKGALYKIWAKAKEFSIEFTPEYEMLLYLFQKAKITEQQLAILTEGKFKALAELGIDITDINPPKRSLKEDQKLFIAAIENSASLEELTELFNHIASVKYKKAPKFKPHHFEFLKTQAEQGRAQPFPKWYYTVAIDVLNKLGIKAEAITSPELVTEHWLRLNKKESPEKTLEEFNKEFPGLKNNAHCQNIIMASFINDALSKMNKTPQMIVTPCIAIEKWLSHWKEKNPDGKKTEAIQAFNKEFSVLAKNNFIIEFFEKFL